MVGRIVSPFFFKETVLMCKREFYNPNGPLNPEYLEKVVLDTIRLVEVDSGLEIRRLSSFAGAMEALAKLERLQTDSSSASIHHLCKRNVLILSEQLQMRLDPEISAKLTGYENTTQSHVILDEAITNLNPDFFWFGVDEIDLKLGIRASKFINFAKPFIVKCSEKSPL
ncbi:hypothetical protein RDI58_020931 [Solanum bulbocastanum]|uniref:Uncharacterized protein n=1 Tax=Solanum bulbocastanum TaxID=147425 RepID=A0AAN8T9Q0_SOLBU